MKIRDLLITLKEQSFKSLIVPSNNIANIAVTRKEKLPTLPLDVKNRL